ncbi:hypothetical protein GCM10020229_50270 [Kitasatospora albolonga]
MFWAFAVGYRLGFSMAVDELLGFAGGVGGGGGGTALAVVRAQAWCFALGYSAGDVGRLPEPYILRLSVTAAPRDFLWRPG